MSTDVTDGVLMSLEVEALHGHAMPAEFAQAVIAALRASRAREAALTAEVERLGALNADLHGDSILRDRERDALEERASLYAEALRECTVRLQRVRRVLGIDAAPGGNK